MHASTIGHRSTRQTHIAKPADDHQQVQEKTNHSLCIKRLRLAVLMRIFSIMTVVGLFSTTVLANESRSIALHEILGEEVLADNAAWVRRHCATMTSAERFEYLSDWVLPTESRPLFRVTSEFSQMDPVPQPGTASDIGASGQLVSPVFDLLDAAKESGQLATLLERIEGLDPKQEEFQRRAQLALLALAHLESGHQDLAASAAQQLLSLIIRNTAVGMADQWPETLVAWRAIDKHRDEVVGGDILMHLFAQRAQRNQPAGYWMWQNQIAALTGRNGHISVRYTTGERPQLLDSAQWIPFSRVRANSRGGGLPLPEWSQTDARVNKIAGHDEDYLFFRSPLGGDFDVECDIASTQVLLGGNLIGNASATEIHVGTLRAGTHVEKVPVRQTLSDWWVHCRRVIRGNECRTYLNGLLVHTENLPASRDPWLAIRSWSRSHGSVRDLRISGQPEILKHVAMSGSKELTGWIAYYNEPVGSSAASWHHVDDPESSGWIQALPWNVASGTFFESLLMYQRPLEQHGAVDYEFFYEPGRVETHPALDRLAFVLQSNGVHLHWITDSPLGPADPGPDNLTFNTEWCRGPEQLPLKPGEWNRVKLALNGQTLSLFLNESLVFERLVEPTNRRLFGLFRWAGDAEVRVRNVSMTGDWPMSLPDIADQELADKSVHQLDQQCGNLKAIFRHDFASQGIPENHFRSAISPQSTLRRDAFGAIVENRTLGAWSASDLRLRFIAHGDFDVEAEFAGLELQSDKDASILLDIHLDDDQLHQLRNLRIKTTDQKQFQQMSVSAMQQSGGRSYSTRVQLPADVYGGRLRLARRGALVHYLFAENDSAQFRLLGTETATDKPTLPDGIQLRALGNGSGHTHVLWKNVAVRADRLDPILDKNAAQRSLYRMNADGSGLQLITAPAFGLSHLGSAEWSSDSKLLICDMSKGGTSTSHLVLMNLDGSNMKDLGIGCMPSLSANGRSAVFSDPNQGIVRMDIDGTNREVLDPGGWGTQWSPDGRTIAWGKGRQIVLLDVASGQRRNLLTPKQSEQIGSLYWNMGWSHDSRWIAFKARGTPVVGNAADLIAVANVESPDEFKVIYSGDIRVNEDFTWHPDNRHVVCAMRVPPGRTLKLVKIDREQSGLPQRIPGLPEKWEILDCDWSPDGKQISFAALVPPEP